MMKVEEIVTRLGLKIFCNSEYLEKEVTGGYVSDLLSDVMGNASEGEIWITMQSHMNVVAIASLKELSAVVIVKDVEPSASVIRRAESEGVVLLGSRYTTYRFTGELYKTLESASFKLDEAS